MMVIYSPIIGWEIFAFEDTHMPDASHPLYLEAGLKFLFATLFLYPVYGLISKHFNTRVRK